MTKKITILFLSILILFSFNFVLAQEIILKDIINPVKRGIEIIPEIIPEITKDLFKKIQRETKQKQREVKQEIKKEVKKEAQGWFQKKIERTEDFLSPLKIKIQQGSNWIRQGVNKVRNFLFNP